MRVKASHSKNSTSLCIIKSIYENGKRSSKVVERLGNLEEIASKHPGTDPWQWARTRAEELTRKEREDTREVLVAYRPNRQIAKGEGWIPAHTRTDLTDDLHQAFGYRTDYQLVSNRQMNKIVRSTKK